MNTQEKQLSLLPELDVETPPKYLDFPMKPLPKTVVHELSRLSRRWSHEGTRSKADWLNE